MCKHPAYGQSLLKIGFPLNDPIVELGAVWARGEAASHRLVNQALISAERWRGDRDKVRSRIAGNLVSKLRTYAEEAKRAEERHHKPRYSERSLTGARNPRRGRKEDRYYADREIRSARRAKRLHAKASYSGMKAMLGRMNPRRGGHRGRPNENEIETVIIRRGNPPITESDAKALQHVLRIHGYACNPVKRKKTNPVFTNPHHGAPQRRFGRRGR